MKKQLDNQSAENKILTDKVNSLVALLEDEKAERQAIERKAIVEKINAINKDFKPDDSMDATALKWILKGMQIAPKSNSVKTSDDGIQDINPQGSKPAYANAYLKTPLKEDKPSAVILGQSEKESGPVE